MNGKTLAICQSCAEHNKGEWKQPRANAPLFLGICDCCKKVEACTHIQYWKNIKPEGVFEVPAEAAKEAEELKDEAANSASSDENKPSAPAPKAPAAKSRANVLGK